MKELIKRLRTHAEYADVITPIAIDMLKAADAIEAAEKRLGTEIYALRVRIVELENLVNMQADCIKDWQWRYADDLRKENYCPNCGANMRGVRETE